MVVLLRLPARGWRSVATILLNVAAGAYGDAAIAGMSIVTRIAMFINAFLIGFGQGFQPVCGFNYGAGLYARVRQGFWFCVKVGFIFLLVCALAGMGFAEEIVSLFRKRRPGCNCSRCCCLALAVHYFSVGFMDCDE